MLLVSKFGGSSLSSAQQFEKVKNIVSSDANRRVVVVSALGKREPTDNKLTDLFYSVYENTSQSSYYEALWQEIVARFVAVKEELNLSYDVEAELKKIQSGLAARILTVDYLVSRGEYLTAKLMSEYLGYEFFDAKDLIIFNASDEVDFEISYQKIAEQIPKEAKVIIPGFYGADQDGEIKLFSRGGSDITGAIIAAGLGADKYENFTDVPGVLMADPRIVDQPRAIPELTYEEMSSIAYMGAEVLHRKSVYPVKQKGIPIHIKNTNDPLAHGTLISDNKSDSASLLTGFFGKKDYTFFTLYKNRASSEIGFIRKVFEIFESYKINIEQSLTGIDHVGILVSSIDVKYCLERVLDDLLLKLGVEDVEMKEEFSLIVIFGRGLIHDPGFLEAIFGTLSKAGIQTSLIEQSPRGLNLVIGVPAKDYVPAIQTLYDGLVRRV